jgi:hypothetical protein
MKTGYLELRTWESQGGWEKAASRDTQEVLGVSQEIGGGFKSERTLEIKIRRILILVDPLILRG